MIYEHNFDEETPWQRRPNVDKEMWQEQIIEQWSIFNRSKEEGYTENLKKKHELITLRNQTHDLHNQIIKEVLSFAKTYKPYSVSLGPLHWEKNSVLTRCSFLQLVVVVRTQKELCVLTWGYKEFIKNWFYERVKAIHASGKWLSLYGREKNYPR